MKNLTAAFRAYFRKLRPASTKRPADAGIHETIQQALNSAGLNQSAQSGFIADTIEQALSSAGLTQPKAGPSQASRAQPSFGYLPNADLAETAAPGQFTALSFANNAGMRAYKLYIPSEYAERPGKSFPLIIMLHGCTQNPDDFAAGTRMNTLAEQHGFLVAYPEQTGKANGSRCWNWFSPSDQQRDRGEPSIIAGITQQVAENYRVDHQRIFIAGLSAGAAMALILAKSYPELYAGIGIHSGLPYRAAYDVPSAFAAMKDARTPLRAVDKNDRLVPMIVFHGDSDRTVAPNNGASIVDQALATHPEYVLKSKEVSEYGTRKSERTVYEASASKPQIEYWVVHGAGHAWFGGSANGSFTDARGPDASAEMVRFFGLQ